MTAAILRHEFSSDLPSRRLRQEAEALQAPAMLFGACLIATLLLACGLLPSGPVQREAGRRLIPGIELLPDPRLAPTGSGPAHPQVVAADPHTMVQPVDRMEEAATVAAEPAGAAQSEPHTPARVEENGAGASVGGVATGSASELQPGAFVYTDELPAPVSRFAPEYPSLARDAGVEGTVLVWALVGLDGSVEQVQVQKSIPMLDEAAREAVRRWRFTPALANKHPVRVWVAVPVRFRLHG